MSLQIWLPLNKQGDFTNRGVGDMRIVSNTAQYNSAGKLGECMYCDGSHRLTIQCQDWFNLNPSTKFSVAVWVKGCTNGDYLFAEGNNSSWELQFRTNTIKFYPSPSSSYYPAYWNTTVDPNRWYHICGTWDGHKSCLYVDGELKCTTTIPSTATFYNFQSTSFHIPFSGTRYINDFRLYDHALSPREVKEISQGLVVHHKLNDICGKNLFVFDKKKYTQDDPFTLTSSKTKYYTTNCKIKALNLVPGKTYTFSCCTDAIVEDESKSYPGTSDFIFYLYTSSTDNIYSWPSTGKYTRFSPSYNLYQEEGYNRYSWRFTMPEGYQACCVRVNHYSDGTNAITSKYWDFKLEEGDVYTPDMWDGVSYDSSGYNNDGTITGDFTMQGDSPRHDRCVKCNGVNNILLKNPLYNYYDSFTFSFWYKHSSDNKQYNVINSNPEPGSGWWMSCNTENGGMWMYINGKYVRYTGSLDTNWHHWVVTYIKDDTLNNYKLYLDGVQHTPTIYVASDAHNSKIPTFAKDLILGGLSNTSSGHYREQYGNISDFRIYSTALSADDVKDLYETSASIDNHGVLHAYDVVENTENIFTLEKLLETVNPDRWVPGSNDYRDPRWVMRNGQAAMSISPSPFYYTSNQDSTGLLYSSHLKKYFKSGKQYKIDLWIDSDDIYDSTNGQSLGGIRLTYTDGSNTSNNLCVMGDVNNHKGFQHITYYTDPTKTVKGLYIYYNLHFPAYYRADSSITEMKGVDIQKSGVVEVPLLVDTTRTIAGARSQYDTNIYEEPDGSRWIRVFHHANPSSSNLFSSTDSFSTHVYKDANRWFDVSICNQLSSWELMIKQKPSSTDTLQKYRWKQYVNPMLATFNDVAANKVIYDTSSGYTTTTFGGLYKLNSKTYLSMNNGATSAWWGAVGSWSSLSSGLPGWNNRTISETGYMDLYVRIDDAFQKETNIYDNKIECNSLIEI